MRLAGVNSQYNVGVDLGLFNNRLAISANYYLSHTQDLLFEATCICNFWCNFYAHKSSNSKIHNTGCDIQVDGRVLSGKDYSFNISGNISN